jgi:hypothetical protein
MQKLSRICSFSMLFLVLAMPAIALAQGDTGLGGVTDKITTLTSQIMTIIQVLMGLCGVVIGYTWAKGDHEARNKTERWLIGCAVVFASSTLVRFFMP